MAGLIIGIIALVVSAGSLIVSLLSYLNSKKVGSAQTKVAEETYKRLMREEIEKESPKITYSEITTNGSNYLDIKNSGNKALNQFSVECEVTDNQSKDNVFQHDYKFPISTFHPGDVLKFRIFVNQGGRRSLRFLCNGKRESGEDFQSTHSHTFVNAGRY